MKECVKDIFAEIVRLEDRAQAHHDDSISYDGLVEYLCSKEAKALEELLTNEDVSISKKESSFSIPSSPKYECIWHHDLAKNFHAADHDHTHTLTSKKLSRRRKERKFYAQHKYDHCFDYSED